MHASAVPPGPFSSHSMHATKQAHANSVMPQRSKLSSGAGNMKQRPCFKGGITPQPGLSICHSEQVST